MIPVTITFLLWCIKVAFFSTVPWHVWSWHRCTNNIHSHTKTTKPSVWRLWLQATRSRGESTSRNIRNTAECASQFVWSVSDASWLHVSYSVQSTGYTVPTSSQSPSLLRYSIVVHSLVISNVHSLPLFPPNAPRKSYRTCSNCEMEVVLVTTVCMVPYHYLSFLGLERLNGKFPEAFTDSNLIRQLPCKPSRQSS